MNSLVPCILSVLMFASPSHVQFTIYQDLVSSLRDLLLSFLSYVLFSLLYVLQQSYIGYGRFLERKIWNLLVYVADRLKKLRGSGELYLISVNIVLM